MGFVLAFFMLVLLLVCGFMTVIILMQRSSANAGMGTALGGGAAESVFGGDTANVLLKNTVIVAVLFFGLSFALYLGALARVKHREVKAGVLPTLVAPPGAAKPAVLPAIPATGAGVEAKPAAAVEPASVNIVQFNPNGTPAATTSTAPATTIPAATPPAAVTPATGNATTPAK